MDTRNHPPTTGARRGDRVGNVLLVLLAPVVLTWTGWSFWRLATVGRLYLREDGRIVDASGGLNFWITLGLYAILTVGALVVLAAFAHWALARIRGRR